MNIMTIDRDSPVPVYYQIELDLKKRIARHEWLVNQQIPPEVELAEQYGVSRVTLRQALAELEKDGIIKKYRGRSAFVSADPTPFIHDLSYVLVSGDRISQQGPSMTAQILELSKVEDLFPEICEQLRVTPDCSAVFIKRLFLLNQKPLAIGRSWLPASLVPGLEQNGLIHNNSLSKTLAQCYQLCPVKVDDYLETVRPTLSECKLLQTTSNTPLILIKGLSLLEDQTPLEYSNTLWLGDAIRFHFSLHHTENGFIMDP